MKPLIGFFALLCLTFQANAQTKIYLHLDSSINRSLTGRLFIFTTTDTLKGVPDQPNYNQPIFALNVSNWTKDRVLEVDDHAEAFSTKLSQLTPGFYKIAAFMDANPDERGGFNPGNCYSKQNALLHVNKEGKNETHVYLNSEIKPRQFKENDSLKLLDLKSDLLSAFHHKDVHVKAAVILPPGYDSNQAVTYPVVYIIPGWGGTHFDALGSAPRKRYGIGMGEPKIYVYLNPETQTRWGLHAFVDSRVNGPWGKALVDEVIPYIRKTYHATTDANKTFVMGQSSGGYPSLWLLLNYPKAFGGGWAVSPDPVDFSNLNGVDLYAPDANFYVDASGDSIPFNLKNGIFETTMKRTISIEMFNDNGGQQVSFEAEFGTMGKNGQPKPLFDRSTGKIDPEVVEDWKPYDLGLFLQKNWKRLAIDLKGKIHVYAGAVDNFQNNKAVEAFQKKVQRLKADCTIEIIPGADHWSIWNEDFTKRIQREIDERIQANP